MKFKDYKREYTEQYGGPVVESGVGLQIAILAGAALSGLALSADRTYHFFYSLEQSAFHGVFGVGAVELFLIGFGASVANRYRTKQARLIQLIGGIGLALISIGIIMGTNTHATLTQAGDAPGHNFNTIMALALGIAAPLLAFFGVKETVYAARNIKGRNQQHQEKWLAAARKQWALDYPQPSSVTRNAQKQTDQKLTKKRNPNAKAALIELIRKNEIENWQDKSGAQLAREAAALGVNVGKSTANNAKGELLNGH